MHNYSPLHYACISPVFTPLQVLDLHDYSPLHYACIWGWLSTATLLLTEGADVNQLNVTGQNCLMIAAECVMAAGVASIDVIVMSSRDAIA